MSTPTIESKDLTLKDVYSVFYAVPDYQREYVWADEEVEQLLTDIHAEFGESGGGAAPEYFIGSIVVCPAEGSVFDLIDGQQRMTTLYLLLCAIRDRLRELGASIPGSLESQIAATDTDETGQDHFRYRVELQYEDSGDILVRFAKGESEHEGAKADTRSIGNIRAAYRVIRTFLQREFAEDQERIRAFYGYLINKVKLIRIRTENVAKALKIFETINDRGVGLDAMDLLKNLLFMKARQAEFERLKEKWKSLVDTLYQAGEKPLRFLRYFIFADYDVDRLREDEIYDWFVKNEKLCGYGQNSLAFADKLVAAASAYAKFLNGKDATGATNRYLENISYLSGAARQHLILLLAARQHTGETFLELCRQVENLFFSYIITRQNTRDFERNFASWAKDLRNVNNLEDLDAFTRKFLMPARNGLSPLFDYAFDHLDADSIQQYRMRYILAKLTQNVNEAAYGSTGAHISLGTYINSKVDIEHILPQSPSEEALEEFGAPDEFDENVNLLGNLALVEKPLNASLGNKPYSQKKPVLAKSQFLLTQSIGKKVEIGVNTSVDRAARDLPVFDMWQPHEVKRRQESLKELARLTWDMPAPIQRSDKQ